MSREKTKRDKKKTPFLSMCHCSSNLRNPALYRTTIIHIWHCYNSKHLLIHHTSAREIHYISSSIQFYKSLFCIIISRVGLPLIDKKKKKELQVEAERLFNASSCPSLNSVWPIGWLGVSPFSLLLRDELYTESGITELRLPSK